MKTINKKTTIMTSITIFALLITASSFIGNQNAFAVLLNINNADFENPALNDGDYTPFGGPGGGEPHPTTWDFTGSSGVFDPTILQMPQGANSGDNVGYGQSAFSTICQDLGDVYEANTVYTLSVYVGDRADTNIPGYDIQLLDESDDSVLAFIDESTGNPPAESSWALNTLEHTVVTGDSQIGHNIKICLSSDGEQTEFDDVSLEANTFVEECSDNDEICKRIFIVHDDLNTNGYIEPHEPVSYLTTITAQNPTDFLWEDVKVQDNLGGDLEIGGSDEPEDDLDVVDNLDCSDSKIKGKTKKVQLRCDVDDGSGDHDLDPNGAETATLEFSAHTDVNPGQGKPGGQGKLEYTSCGIHFANSGATVSGFDTDLQTTFAFSTDGIFVEVFTADKAGDCDEDTVNDAIDNCPFTSNVGQADNYGTDLGDACEDTDGDTVLDDTDVCPLVEDPNQEDTDGNGVGDACNSGEDTDGDEYADGLDNCPDDANADQTDTDGDGVGDACDVCPLHNPDDNADGVCGPPA